MSAIQHRASRSGWHVALDAGTTALRLAGYEPDGPVGASPRLLAEVAAPAEPRDLLAALLPGPPAELLLVHRAGRPPDPAWWSGPAAPGRVRPVPAALAVAEGSPGPLVVVDAGHTGSEVVLLRPGRQPMVRRTAVGGARLDAVTRALLGGRVSLAQAGRVREALSLLPEAEVEVPGGGRVRLGAVELRAALAEALGPVVDAVRAVLAATGREQHPPLRLVGGLARTPLLAELLDAAGIPHVEVAERPEAAAVLGALRAAPAPAPPAPSPTPVGPPLLPPLRPRRGVRTAALGVGAAGLLAAAVATEPHLLPPPRPAVPAGLLVQYGYALDVPPGWAHTGGLPERRRSLLTPADAPRGADLVAVELTPLGYDAEVEPQRVRAELRERFDAAVAAGEPLTGFDANAGFAGRRVVTYRQTGDVTVDWYVVLDGTAQLSVGCQYTAAGAATVREACAAVVASVRRAP